MGDLNLTMRRNPPPQPPVRTNSLRVPGMDGPQTNVNTFVSANGISCNTASNATSFLRIPKLGTLTATTNKMLASGGHIQTLSSGQQQMLSTRSIYAPVREAPLPPAHHSQQHQFQQHMIQSVIPEKIDEETCVNISAGYGHESQLNCSSSVNPNATNSITYNNNPQLSSPDEFPPPPPCQ